MEPKLTILFVLIGAIIALSHVDKGIALRLWRFLAFRRLRAANHVRRVR